MSDRYVPREEPSPNNRFPISPREQERWQRIRQVLVTYVVKGTEEEIDFVAHQLWRVSK